MREITLTFTLTEEEVVEYARFTIKTHRRNPFLVWLLIALMTLMIASTGSILVWHWYDLRSGIAGTIMVTSAIGFVIYCLFKVKSEPTRISRKFRGGDIYQPQTVIISEEGFTDQATRSTVQYKWNDLSRIEENREAIYFFISDLVAHVVPHRVWPDEETRRETMAAIEQIRVSLPPFERVCPECGYDLRQIESTGCPECGWRRNP